MANIPGTNVPAIQWTDAGFVAPSGPAVLAGYQADINAAFGQTLSYDLRTPQGQLASSGAATLVNVNGIFVYYTNQVDPATATGRMQDAIARIYNITRFPAEPTVLQVACLGAEGVVIPETTATVSDGSGNVYVCTAGGTIPASGTITLPFACSVAGPTVIPDEVSIYKAIPGWDRASVISGVVGQNTETRSQFEARRLASVAKNSRGQLSSVEGEVMSIPGVLDAYVTENVEITNTTIRGFVLAPKSLYVAAVGGDAAAVAKAIWTKKAPGCGYNGNTTVVVQDDNSGYSPPVPSYDVTFEIPASLAILFAVIITDGPQVPANAVALIQDAILAAFSGQDGGARARIGSTVYASRYVTPVLALGDWVQLQSLKVGSNNTGPDFTASIAGTTMTVTAVLDGVLAAGQTISDDAGAVIVGTQIVSQLSGATGGIGTYTIAPSQTVTSTAMHGTVASDPFVEVQIDQSPTCVAANILVTLA